MKEIVHYIKEFHYYVFYLGIKVRKWMLRKKPEKITNELLAINLRFWMAFFIGFIAIGIVSLVVPIENVSNTNDDEILFYSIIIVKLVIDEYTFYWGSDWVIIVETFDNKEDKSIFKIYNIIFGLLVGGGIISTIFSLF